MLNISRLIDSIDPLTDSGGLRSRFTCFECARSVPADESGGWISVNWKSIPDTRFDGGFRRAPSNNAGSCLYVIHDLFREYTGDELRRRLSSRRDVNKATVGYLCEAQICRVCSETHIPMTCAGCATRWNSETLACPYCVKKCPRCGEVTSKLGVVNRQLNWCQACIKKDCRKCSRCGNLWETALTTDIRIQTEHIVCNPCSQTYYRYCKKCNVWTERGSNCVGPMFEYNHKPMPVFHGKSGRELFFGLEIEVETCQSRADASDKAAKLLGTLAYIKRDSSIQHGFEIVTHPIAFDALKTELGQKRLASLAELAHADDEPSCGLHVHMSRAAFTDETLYNFMYFTYANVSFIKAVAGRDTDVMGVQPGAFDTRQERRQPTPPAPFNTYTLDQLDALCHGRLTPYDRHVAVNIIPEHTVEVRYFASTLNHDLLHARLQFLHALHGYTRRRTKLGAVRVNPFAFARYVARHSAKYPELTIKMPDWLGVLNATSASSVTEIRQADLVPESNEQLVFPRIFELENGEHELFFASSRQHGQFNHLPGHASTLRSGASTGQWQCLRIGPELYHWNAAAAAWGAVSAISERTYEYSIGEVVNYLTGSSPSFSQTLFPTARVTDEEYAAVEPESISSAARWFASNATTVQGEDARPRARRRV